MFYNELIICALQNTSVATLPLKQGSSDIAFLYIFDTLRVTETMRSRSPQDQQPADREPRQIASSNRIRKLFIYGFLCFLPVVFLDVGV